MKFKRLLAVVLACCICCTVLVLPASAENNIISNNSAKYYAYVYEQLLQYRSGEIDLGTFLGNTYSKYMDTGVDNIGQAFTNIADIVKSLSPFSDDSWNDWYYENKMGGDGGGGHRDDSELKGYGAILKIYNSKGVLNTVYYGDYGIFRNIKETQFDVFLKYTHIAKYDYNSGDLLSENDVDSSIAYTHYIPSSNGLRQYLGDWRNSDGSSNDDFVSEFPEKEIPPYDDDSVPEDDLIDFLEDLLNDLQLKFPDLSTI